MNNTENKLDFWAVLELFGHQKIAGKITEQTLGSSVMIRVTVPKTEHHPEYDRLFNPSAVYAINPMEESLVRTYAAKMNVAPITPYEASQMFDKLIEEKVQRRLNPKSPESNDFDNDDFPDNDQD